MPTKTEDPSNPAIEDTNDAMMTWDGHELAFADESFKIIFLKHQLLLLLLLLLLFIIIINYNYMLLIIIINCH